MPGEPAVELAWSPMARRLLGALRDLSAIGVDFALVGGLAVMARVAEAYRVTEDLDIVSADESFLDVVVARPGGEFTGNTLRLRGVPIDRIEVPAVVDWGAIAALESERDRLFTSAHAWAVATATGLTIRSRDLAASVSVAEVPALLAAKLHAFLSSRRDPRKVHSDALDVVCLAQALVRSPHPWMVVQLPVALAALRRAIDEVFGRRPTEVVRRIRVMVPGEPPIREDEVRALGEVLGEGLSR